LWQLNQLLAQHSQGKYTYDFGDTAHLTPLVKMHTLGNSFVPEASIQAGYGIMAWHPASHIVELGLIEPRAEKQLGCFAAGYLARAEGIPPAPEANHAVKGAMMRHCAVKRKESGKTIRSTCAVMVTSICRRTWLIRRGCCVIQCRRSSDGAGRIACN